jgi:uncharacterized Zn-finger protein
MAPRVLQNLSPDRLLRQTDFKRFRHRLVLAKCGPMLQTHWQSEERGQSQEEQTMAGGAVPHFQNDAGHATIEIGVKEFTCVGAEPPFDHPHVFLDMGHDDEKVCPYCSTLYRYSPALKPDETRPEGSLYIERTA